MPQTKNISLLKGYNAKIRNDSEKLLRESTFICTKLDIWDVCSGCTDDAL